VNKRKNEVERKEGKRMANMEEMERKGSKLPSYVCTEKINSQYARIFEVFLTCSTP
jgi:hypothetical protein